MQRVHIVGPPRTGTSLMLELMRTCFNFAGCVPQESSVLEPPPQPCSTMLGKRPGDHVFMAPVLEAAEGHWFLFMLRDPRDVVVSRHRRAPDRYWANLQHWRAADASIRQVVDHPRVLVVRYESLVTEPDRAQEDIARRLPFLSQLCLFSRFHEHSQPSAMSLRAMGPVRPPAPDSIGSWRQHKARLKGQLSIHGSISQELIHWGYERNEDWLNELAAIEPDTSPGFFPENASAQRQQAQRRELAEGLPRYLQYLDSLRGASQ